MKPFNMNAVVRGAIRRTFSRAPIKQEVLRENRKEFPKFNKDGSRSKKDAVCYLCNVCKEYRGSTKVTVDHILPVISVEDGFINWDTFVDRLYCGKDNLQVICDDCHQVKTNAERLERTIRKEYTLLTKITIKITTNESITKDDIKFIKKLTPKRIDNYPEDFKRLAKIAKEHIN